MTDSRTAFVDAIFAAPATSDCIDWPFTRDRKGYGVWVIGAHRTVCLMAHGQPPSHIHQAAHSCGRPSCVNPAHLRWATPKENQADQLRHGTRNRGTRNGRNKLMTPEVLEIRRRVAAGESNSSLGREFGVSNVTVSLIVSRKRWSWLADAAEATKRSAA